MAKAGKTAVAEKIKVVNQPEETTEAPRFKLWMVIPAITVLAATTFFVVRRFTSNSGEEQNA